MLPPALSTADQRPIPERGTGHPELKLDLAVPSSKLVGQLGITSIDSLITGLSDYVDERFDTVRSNIRKRIRKICTVQRIAISGQEIGEGMVRDGVLTIVGIDPENKLGITRFH